MTAKKDSVINVKAKKNIPDKNCYDVFTKTLKGKYTEVKQSQDEGYRNYRENWGKIPKSEQDFPSVPYQVDIDVVDACNLQCYYCFDRTRRRTGKSMSEATIKSLLEQIKIHPVYALNLGFCTEPLLRFDLVKQIFDKARTECSVSDLFIHTNGLLLTKEVATYLIDTEIDLICLSFDAGTKETYKQITKSDAFERVVANIKRLKDIRDASGKMLPKIRISMVVLKENMHEKNLFYEKWKNVADKIELQNYRNVCKTVNRPLQDFSGKMICPWPFTRMSIWPDGTIGVCPFTGSLAEDLALPYNINVDDIREVWRSPELRSIRAKMFQKCVKTCLSCQGDFEPIRH